MNDSDDESRDRRVIVTAVTILIAVVLFVLTLIFLSPGPSSTLRLTVGGFISQLAVWILPGFIAFGLLAAIIYLIRRGK